jgi:hypothetical protein
MISLKIGAIMVAMFIAGAFVASPALRAYAAATVGSAEIIDNSIQSVDIKDGQVKSADLAGSAVTSTKIAGNAVTSAKIADSTIAYGDVSRSLIAVEHRDDCNCGGTGWDPDGNTFGELIVDSRITQNSLVSVSFAGVGVPHLNCMVIVVMGSASVSCDTKIPNGVGINYGIFNNPAYG